MKILAIQPAKDTPDRINYQVNYSLWDAIEKITEFTRGELGCTYISYPKGGYDVVFLPMNIRWLPNGNTQFLDELKRTGIPLVMFDNDDLRRKHNDPLYDGIDLIFSRMYNDNGRAWLPWCVNTDLYTPVYGGEFISMPASRTEPYKLRREIASKFKGQINLEQPKGAAYIKHLQRSKAVICTGSEECRVTRAKVLEAAACGCLIITEETQYLEKYLGAALKYKMAFTFKDINELPGIFNYINNDKILNTRQSVMVSDIAELQSAKLQARKVVAYIESFLNGKPDKDILHSIQNPLDLVEA